MEKEKFKELAKEFYNEAEEIYNKQKMNMENKNYYNMMIYDFQKICENYLKSIILNNIDKICKEDPLKIPQIYADSLIILFKIIKNNDLLNGNYSKISCVYDLWNKYYDMKYNGFGNISNKEEVIPKYWEAVEYCKRISKNLFI